MSAREEMSKTEINFNKIDKLFVRALTIPPEPNRKIHIDDILST